MANRAIVLLIAELPGTHSQLGQRPAPEVGHVAGTTDPNDVSGVGDLLLGLYIAAEYMMVALRRTVAALELCARCLRSQAAVCSIDDERLV